MSAEGLSIWVSMALTAAGTSVSSCLILTALPSPAAVGWEPEVPVETQPASRAANRSAMVA